MHADSTQKWAEEVLSEIRAIALSRVTDVVSVKDGVMEIRASDELSGELAASVASIEKTSTGLRLKFYDKLKALELLGKYLGLFEQKSVWQSEEGCNLLEAIICSTKEDLNTDDLPEVQQAAASCDDVVEPSVDARV